MFMKFAGECPTLFIFASVFWFVAGLRLISSSFGRLSNEIMTLSCLTLYFLPLERTVSP